MNLMAQRGETSALERALLQGSDVNETDGDWFPLMMGVAMNQIGVVEILLKHNALVDQTDQRGISSLALAVQECHVECMTLLLEKGADPNKANAVGTTPLVVAAQTGNADVVDILLRHKADPTLKTQSGTTPLHAAVRSWSTNVVEKLLEAGADPDSEERNGQTPLLSAIYAHDDDDDKDDREEPSKPVVREAMVSILLAAKADVDKGSAESPLTACVTRGSSRLARRLLEASADPNKGGSLHELAKSTTLSVKKQVEMAELLLENGARLEGKTLQVAVELNRKDLVRLLLRHGADPNYHEASGETPIRVATSRLELAPIVDLLEAAGAVDCGDALDVTNSGQLREWIEVTCFKGDDSADTLLEELDAETVFSSDNQPDFTLSQLTEEKAELWRRKLKRHGSLQRDRAERNAIAGETLPPMDNAEARHAISRHLNDAAVGYARAEILSEEDLFQEVNRHLDDAISTCLSESERLRSTRATWLRERYQALKERWSTLVRVKDSVVDMPELSSSWWPHRPDFFSNDCGHLRIRAAAARPVLYGALSYLLKRVHETPSATGVGLSRSDGFFLPFCDESWMLTAQGKRASLVSKPTHRVESRTTKNSPSVVVAGIAVEDPYVMAVIIAAISSHRTLPLRLRRLKQCDEGLYTLYVLVEYPKDAEMHEAIGSPHPFDEKLAGKPLMMAEISLGFEHLSALRHLEAPYRAVAKAPNSLARRLSLMSQQHTEDIIDKDTWQPVDSPPAVVAAHHAKLGHDLGGGDVAELEAKLGAYSEALAAAKTENEARVQQAQAELAQVNQQLAQTRADLTASHQSALARDDELRKLKDELYALKSPPASPTTSTNLAFDKKPNPPPKHKTRTPKSRAVAPGTASSLPPLAYPQEHHSAETSPRPL